MKEIMAMIRVNKVEETREALKLNGFHAHTCRKCLGRGKNALSSAGQSLFMATDTLSPLPEGGFAENRRLIAKRLFLIVVEDDEVSKAVNIIMKANQTGNPGDGKIFVRRLAENYCIRTGEREDL